MLRQGVQLLEALEQDEPRSVFDYSTPTADSISIGHSVPGNSFVSYIDADWGTQRTRPAFWNGRLVPRDIQEEPAGIPALDPPLTCYSWMTGIHEVAQIVFVRKQQVEVQYLRKPTISEGQWQEFATLSR